MSSYEDRNRSSSAVVILTSMNTVDHSEKLRWVAITRNTTIDA